MQNAFLPRVDITIPTATTVGRPEAVFVRAATACAPTFFPDTAAKGFRDWTGKIHLLATWQQNYALEGMDFNSLHLNCQLLYQGKHLPNPAAFDDHGWLTSFYTDDGRTVFALIHDEYHGAEHPGACAFRDNKHCWYNAITSTKSLDGGKTFNHPPPSDNLVATLPYRFGTVPMPAGYFEPSNILKVGHFYYVAVRAEHRGLQLAGTCILRTSDLSDPKSWRAWGGRDYTVEFINPYHGAAIMPAEHICSAVSRSRLAWPVSSIVHSSAKSMFIAVMQATSLYPAGLVKTDGIYLSYSKDLLDWSVPKLLMSARSVFRFDCHTDEPIMHPSLLDTSSTDRNFIEIGEHPYLFYSIIHLKDCRLSKDVDLMRQQITIR